MRRSTPWTTASVRPRTPSSVLAPALCLVVQVIIPPSVQTKFARFSAPKWMGSILKASIILLPAHNILCNYRISIRIRNWQMQICVVPALSNILVQDQASVAQTLASSRMQWCIKHSRLLILWQDMDGCQEEVALLFARLLRCTIDQ